jgi:hypothetical protein
MPGVQSAWRDIKDKVLYVYCRIIVQGYPNGCRFFFRKLEA